MAFSTGVEFGISINLKLNDSRQTQNILSHECFNDLFNAMRKTETEIKR